jgi:multiple sugar transport system substrate-binding protein
MTNVRQPSSPRLTRREMLKLSGALGAGALLAACAPATSRALTPTSTEASPTLPPTTEVPTTAPTSAPVEGKVVVMKAGDEFNVDRDFGPLLEANLGLEIEVIEVDFTRFFSMYAAGNSPDLLRVQAPSIPQLLARKTLYDLTPYFETSLVLKPDDLAPANDYYKANSPQAIGSGKLYGMVKDWSPDFTLWIYKPAFEAVNVAVPSDDQPMTYEAITQLARQLTKFDGDRVVTWGYGYGTWWLDRIWMNMLAEKNQGLYADDFTTINLTPNDEARRVMQYYFDLNQNNLVANPLNPSPSWNGDDFNQGTEAILQYGYWFSGLAESEVTREKIALLPAPTWAGVRRDPTITATGFIISATTLVPEAAWRVFEFYHGQEPARERAKRGAGVPGLKSLYSLMPVEGNSRAQVSKVLQSELDLNTPLLQFNPFLGESTVTDAWEKNLDQALHGFITFDDLLHNVETEVNQAIKEGMDRIG